MTRLIAVAMSRRLAVLSLSFYFIRSCAMWVAVCRTTFISSQSSRIVSIHRFFGLPRLLIPRIYPFKAIWGNLWLLNAHSYHMPKKISNAFVGFLGKRRASILIFFGCVSYAVCLFLWLRFSVNMPFQKLLFCVLTPLLYTMFQSCRGVNSRLVSQKLLFSCSSWCLLRSRLCSMRERFLLLFRFSSKQLLQSINQSV